MVVLFAAYKHADTVTQSLVDLCNKASAFLDAVVSMLVSVSGAGDVVERNTTAANDSGIGDDVLVSGECNISAQDSKSP